MSRNLPISLTDHIATGVTTLAYCWVVTRADGAVVGFTDHDNDLTVDGKECLSTTGITTSKFTQSLNLAVDDMEIEGVIDDDQITDEDIKAGKYDNATVEIYIVNWQDVTQFYLMASGTFGNLTETEGGAFMTEFRSNAYVINQPEGRAVQRTCDAKLGDSRCGIDLTESTYRATTTVQVVNDQEITLLSLSGFDDDFFTLGQMVLEGGEVLGIRQQTGSQISLWRRPEASLSPGDTVTVVAGCKQDSATCRVKFDNINNFRGFPFVPGNDSLTSYPVRGESNYNGGSLFNG